MSEFGFYATSEMHLDIRWVFSQGQAKRGSSWIFTEVSSRKSMKHKVGKSPNECRRVIQTLGHMKTLDTQMLGQLASFDIEFVKRFEVVGHEGNRHHENSLSLICREGLKRLV